MHVHDTSTVKVGRTDGRTTYDSNTALALGASRGKNSTSQDSNSVMESD